MTVLVRREDPGTEDAQSLIDECTAVLALFSGDGEQARFKLEEVCSVRGAFVVARSRRGAPLGCGAFRRFDYGVAELMRIYSRGTPPDIGRAILTALEAEALTAGYKTLIAQTHGLNARAIAFYEDNGFEPIERPAASVSDTAVRCFAKQLVQPADGTLASRKHENTDSTESGEHN